MSVVPTLRMLRVEDYHEFKANLGYIACWHLPCRPSTLEAETG